MFINFSKPIELEYNNDYFYYESANKAIDDLYEKFNHEFSKSFIKYMIRSGELNINNWFSFYNTDYNRNFKQIGNKISNKKNLKLLKTVLERDNLLTQDDIYRLTDLNDDQYYGICILTSIWNCFPFLFDYNPKELKKQLENIGENDFKDSVSVVEKLNESFRKETLGKPLLDLHQTKNGSEIDYFITDSINKSRPIVLGLLNELLKNKDGHAVSILGYDEYNYYLFDNETYSNDICEVREYLVKACKENILDSFYKNKDDKYKLKRWKLKLNKLGLERIPNLVLTGKDFEQEIESKFTIKSKYIIVDKQIVWYSANWCDIIYITPEVSKLRIRENFNLLHDLIKRLDNINFDEFGKIHKRFS